MQRELKFRVWDGTSMYYPLYPFSTNNCDSMGNACITQGLGGCSHIADTKDCIIQQFTGLKDKNGKDIYEGDILSVTVMIRGAIEEWTIYSKVYWDNRNPCFMLQYNQRHYSVKDNLAKAINNEMTPYMKIVGNIYEDTELNFL